MEEIQDIMIKIKKAYYYCKENLKEYETLIEKIAKELIENEGLRTASLKILIIKI